MIICTLFLPVKPINLLSINFLPATMFLKQSKAVEYMRRVAEWDKGSVRYAALYNLGRAYMQGYGVQASREEAEK